MNLDVLELPFGTLTSVPAPSRDDLRMSESNRDEEAREARGRSAVDSVS